MGKMVILLNGPSSSGKSTLAGTLQKNIQLKRNEEYGVISIDDFLIMTPEKPIYEDDVFEISSKICEKAIEILESKQGIIIDHVITSERIFNQLMAALKAYHIYLIQVMCPLSELRKREAERKNRALGSAEGSYEYLFPKDGYDLTMNTFKLSSTECSLRIINAIS